MMGDVVNLAARLMQHANAEIVVDKNTYDAAVKEINFDIRPTIHVKVRLFIDPFPCELRLD
jgi:class 3 adenylate cyclase